MNMALSSSKQSHAEISRLAEDVLADKLRGISGVATVNISGALKRELSVLLRSEKLREHNVWVGEVVAALRAQNTNAPMARYRVRWMRKASAWWAASRPPKNFKASWSNVWADKSYAWPM